METPTTTTPLFDSKYWKSLEKKLKLPQPLDELSIHFLEELVQEQIECECKAALLNTKIN